MEQSKNSQWPPDRVSAIKSIDTYIEARRKANPQDYYNEIFNHPKIEIKMKEEIKQTEKPLKTKRFSVLDGKTEVINTDKKQDANEAWVKLQKESKPLIVFIDHKVKFSLRATKTIHQKNYRIESGDYEKDSAIKPAQAAPETQD